MTTGCQHTAGSCLTRRAVLAAGGGLGAAALVACAREDPVEPGGTASTEDGSPTEDPTTEDPTSDEATSEDPTTEEPTTEEPPAAESLGNIADVPIGGALAVTTADETELLLTQPTEGEVLAFSAICTHNGCTVDPDDGELRCPCHYSTFDLATGDVTGGPADAPLPQVDIALADDGTITLV